MVPSGHGEKTHGPAETLRMREGRVRGRVREQGIGGEGISGGERRGRRDVGERDPMVEASNGGISRARAEGKKRKRAPR